MDSAEAERLKTCSTCGDVFDSALSPNTRSRCRPCTTAYKAQWRKTEKGARLYRDGQARYLASDKGRHAGKRKRQTPHGKARALAHAAVGTEIAAGRLPPARIEACEFAGPECAGSHDYHHDSYLPSDRLVVRPLCRAHHAAWHRKNDPVYPDAHACIAAVKAAKDD